MELLSRLDEVYAELLRGDLELLESRWKWRLGLLGQPVVAETATGPVRGRLLDLTFAAVELQTETGVVRRPPEGVRHLAPA
jgi:hypothetical protein